MPRTPGLTSLNLDVPADYLLTRDYCSYGYFLLAPNHWEPSTQSVTRTLELDEGAATVRITQPGPASRGARALPRHGVSLRVEADRTLTRAEQAQARQQLSRMLRLEEDHALIGSFHKVDPRWKKRGSNPSTGRGRLMRSPTFFEDIIKTVTSCNVTWPSTVSMNRRLCESLGERSPSGGFAFPSATRLAKTRPQTLRARCGVGYRDARIVELARLFTTAPGKGGIDAAWYENPSTSDDAIHEALLALPGIGPYAAANVMQLLGRYARLPLDTESLRHAKSVLGMTGLDRQINKRLHAHYAPFGAHAFRSYWLELWAFYESRQGPAWTWVRENTAKAFTAAMLKEKPE